MRRFRDDDSGMVTAFVVITSVTLLFVAGLVFEGGRILAAKRETLNVAESAARAGAQALDEDAVRAGDTDILNEVAAAAAVCDFLAHTDDFTCGDATIAAGDNKVTVNLTGEVDLVMLDVANQSFTLSGTACVARGITGTEPTAQCDP